MMDNHQNEDMLLLEMLLYNYGSGTTFDEFLRICHKAERLHRNTSIPLFTRVMNSYIRKSIIDMMS